jgi:hypothetical protein
MSYSDTGFSTKLDQYGGWTRIFSSVDFILALLIGIIGGGAILAVGGGDAFAASTEVPFIAVSSAMIASSLAGLAIVASISDAAFVKFAKGTPVGTGNVYDNIVFIFWYATLVGFVSLLADVIGGILVAFVRLPHLSGAVSAVTLFLVIYNILAVVILLGTISRWGFYRGAFVLAGNPEPPKCPK